nr:hypothetical protein BaRGS_011478 [Batillaria attramentaria]
MTPELVQKNSAYLREVLGDFLSWLAQDHDMLLLPKAHRDSIISARLHAAERSLLSAPSPVWLDYDKTAVGSYDSSPRDYSSMQKFCGDEGEVLTLAQKSRREAT